MATDSVDSGQENEPGHWRAEIDTSAPFESVKEAANRFGGMAVWKPISYNPSENASENDGERMVDVVMVEKEAADLERNLITKERETLDVLKELEATKYMIELLKLKLQKEASEINEALKTNSVDQVPEDVNHEINDNNMAASYPNGVDSCPIAAPGQIPLELKHAKLNSTRSTDNLPDIRATVDLYNKKIERERTSLEKTRQELSSNSSTISRLEEELNQTRQKLEMVNEDEAGGISHDDSLFDIKRELKKLSSETQRFKKVGETAKSEVLRTMSEIEKTKIGIKTAEIRLVAAKRMKEAARASEAVAHTEIKALSCKCDGTSENITLSLEQYSTLKAKVQEAKKSYQARVQDAMLRLDEANVFKMDIFRKVEEATEEVKISKKALEEALSRVETANQNKLEVEESFRRWRSERGQKGCSSLHNSTKFKNSHSSSPLQNESHLVDVNGLYLVNYESKPVLKPTLSIGQILSQKLLLTENNEKGKSNVLPAQMLVQTNTKEPENENGELPSKRKTFRFARISQLVAKQSMKKNKETTAMCRST